MNATTLAAIAALPLILYFVTGFVFYFIAVARSKKAFLDDDPSRPDSLSLPDEALSRWWEEQPKTEVRIRSADGLELAADWLPAPGGELRPAFAAVLAHGYSGTGPTMKRYARLFRERFSCDILTPDLRGHGRSEGGYIGFGLRDAEDLRLWIDRVAVLRGSELPVVLFGVSMGGAAVLGAAGTDLPPNVACAVSDCAFSDARAILAYKARRLYHIPAFPAVDALRTATALLARYDLAEASPRRSAARAAVPLLLIHGEADTFVPPSMARELYDAAPRGRAELYLVPEAGHAEAYRTAGGAYADRVETFVRASLAGC